jgi:Xaa-Pro aminopeptidase
LNLRISAEEMRQRREQVLREVGGKGFETMVLFNATSIFYLTGFPFIPTERPACLVLHGGGKSFIFVPHLEIEHGKEAADVDEVFTYPEYPGETHPMVLLAGLMADKKLAGKPLAADAHGYASPWGYDGPSLEEVMPGIKVSVFAKLVERLRMIKSPQEIVLIRESAKWGNLAHALLQKYTKAGLPETAVEARAGFEATEAMNATLGPAFEPRGGFGRSGASAGFRSQIGPHSALPHAITKNLTFKRGDVLGTGAGSVVWGYGSELERTMFVEEVSDDHRRFFNHMVNLQDIAFEAIKPGIPCSDVDRAVLRYYDREGLRPYWRHHVGHNLGLLGHEAPFLDIGDKTIIEPGMVFSVEPGIYVPGLGGYRHSDTVVVTETGIDMITYYPRDLESLICR